MLAQSKVTSQVQISVPMDVRRILGVGPGSVLEWEEQDGEIVIRRAVRFSSADIHQALFAEISPEPLSIEQMKEGIRTHAKKRLQDLNAGD